MPTATAPQRLRRPAPPIAATATPAAAAPRTPAAQPSGPGVPGLSRRTIGACAVIVVGSLLMVVGADAYLTEGQVRLTRLQDELTQASGTHRDLESRVARLANPSSVISRAEAGGLGPPGNVTDLPEVSVPPPMTVSSTASSAHTSTTQTPSTASTDGR